MKRRITPPSIQAIEASQENSEFRSGRRELLKAPGYEQFRNLVIRDFRRAKEEILRSPECVKYAAVMMSDAEIDLDVCLDAGTLLLYAAKGGADIKPALTILAGIMLTDVSPRGRASAARIIAEGAIRGTDIKSTYTALGAALEDPAEQVRYYARKALEAAGQVS